MTNLRMIEKSLLLAVMSAFLLSSTTAWAEESKEDDAKEETQQGAKDSKEKGSKDDAEVSSSSDEEEDADEDEEADEEDDRKWSISLGATTRIGQGTFYDPEDTGEIETRCQVGLSEESCDPKNAFDRWANFYSISPGYQISDDFSLSASWSFRHWLTAGGNINRVNEVRISDISLGLGWAGHTFDKTNTSISGGLGLGIPISRLSRQTSQILDTSASFSVRQRLVEKVSLGLSVSGGRTFHRYTSPVADLTQIGDGGDEGIEGGPLFRPNGAEDLGDNLVAIGGRNTQHFVSGGLSLSVPVIKKMRASMSYRYSTFWSYKAEIPTEGDDPLRAEYAQTDRRGDAVSGSIGLSYSLPKNLGLRLSLSTSQSPKTSDQRSYRFPFWNFEYPAANRSAVSLGLSYSY